MLAYTFVVDGEFLMEWCKHFGKCHAQNVSYVALLEPLI